MGEPRLSDMAPDLAYKHPSRSNSLKRSQENAQYLPLPASEEEEEMLEEDEVFIENDSTRYINFSAVRKIGSEANTRGTEKMHTGCFSSTLYIFETTKFASEPSSPRRHSIGNFNTRDRANSVASSSRSFKDDFSTTMQENAASTSAIDEHSLRHMSYPRKRCLKCSKGKFSKTL